MNGVAVACSSELVASITFCLLTSDTPSSLRDPISAVSESAPLSMLRFDTWLVAATAELTAELSWSTFGERGKRTMRGGDGRSSSAVEAGRGWLELLVHQR